MPETVVGVAGSVVVAQCTSPKDGDYVTGASIKVALQGIEDDLATIAALRINGGSPSRLCSAPWAVSGVVHTGRVTVPIGGYAEMLLPLPHGQIFSSVAIHVVPGAHAAMPATKPRIGVSAYGLDGTVSIVEVSYTDPETVAATYSVAHDLSFTLGSPLTVDRHSNVYVLRLYGENGANGADIDIGPPLIGGTVASLDVFPL